MSKQVLKTLILVTVLPIVAVSCNSTGGPQQQNTFSFENGELQRPTGYREWVYVGTPVTPNDMNNGAAAFPEFHNVYIHPSSWGQWKNTGNFPEGTILVKELVDVGSKQAVSGAGYFQGEYIGLEAVVKSESLFPDEPGNWAFFSFTTGEEDLKPSAAAFPTASCNSCHQVSASTDYIFTQYYPVLRDARNKGHDGTFD